MNPEKPQNANEETTNEPDVTPVSAPISEPEATPITEPAVAPVDVVAPVDEPGNPTVSLGDIPTPALEPALTEEPPVTPYVATGNTHPASPQKKKKILVASIAAGLLLIVGAGLGIYYLLTNVSDEDYRRAEAQLTEIRRADTAMVREVTSLSRSSSIVTEATFDEKLADARASLGKIKSENETLAKEKAVRYGEGADLYGAFNTKAQAYFVYADELIASIDKVRPALAPCQKIGSSSVQVDDRASVVDDCVAELKKAGDLPNAEFNRYFGSLKDKYAAYSDLYVRFGKLTAPNGSQRAEYNKISAEANTLLTEIRSLRTEFLKDLDARDKETSLKDVSDDLRDFFKDQRS